MEIIGYIVVAILAIGISPILKGLVNKFVEEDRLEEEAEKKKEADYKKKGKQENNRREESKQGKEKQRKNKQEKNEKEERKKEKSINEKRKEEKEKKEKKEKDGKVKLVPEFDWKVTAVTVLAEIILFIQFGFSLTFVLYAFLTVLLIICMFADIKGCIIPNEVNFLGFIVGIVLAFVKMSYDVQAGLDSLGGMLIGFLIFLAIAGLSLLIYKKEGMGGGDIKLMGVIGLYLGIMNNIQVFILSFFLAAIISILLLATKRKKSDDYIPFGPFIVLAAYITMLFPASVTMPALLQLLG